MLFDEIDQLRIVVEQLETRQGLILAGVALKSRTGLGGVGQYSVLIASFFATLAIPSL